MIYRENSLVSREALFSALIAVIRYTTKTGATLIQAFSVLNEADKPACEEHLLAEAIEALALAEIVCGNTTLEHIASCLSSQRFGIVSTALENIPYTVASQDVAVVYRHLEYMLTHFDETPVGLKGQVTVDEFAILVRKMVIKLDQKSPIPLSLRKRLGLPQDRSRAQSNHYVAPFPHVPGEETDCR